MKPKKAWLGVWYGVLLISLSGICPAAAALPGKGSALGKDDEALYIRIRERMVSDQLGARDITDKRVLQTMGVVPRHLFVPPYLRGQSYEDYPLPIGNGQTISQPYIVALMTQWASLKGGERVLEVGTGSGYQAAVLSRLVDRVFSVEIDKELSLQAARRLKELGFLNVEVKWGDGYQGWEEKGPFDAVLVTCAARHLPPALFRQLKEGGRIVIPLEKSNSIQTLTLVEKSGGKPRIKPILEVRFVPMTGEIDKNKIS